MGSNFSLFEMFCVLTSFCRGQSAGAGSVVAQVIANGGQTMPRLFTKALASSPFWPKTYRYDAPQAQSIYDTLAELTHCAGPNSLQCLKTIDVQAIRSAALYISYSHTYNTSSYTWAPVIDGNFIRQPLSQATARGEVNVDYGWGMYNLHEGENFIPPGLQNATNTTATSNGFASPPYNASIPSFENWLHGYLPDMCEEDYQRAQQLYPADGTAEELTYNSTYVRAGLIYRDTVLACPAYWMARASHRRSYVGEYTISPAKHGSDTEWVGCTSAWCFAWLTNVIVESSQCHPEK
jgi:carboxylesterase type B